jgi:hypothetical protein
MGKSQNGNQPMKHVKEVSKSKMPALAGAVPVKPVKKT